MGISLPPEILFTIFILLPAKSILRLRCACKLFSSITSNPAFLRSHRPTPRLLLQPILRQSSASLHLLTSTTPNPVQTLTLTLEGEEVTACSPPLSLFTSCDGMLCFTRVHDAVAGGGGCCIWDPAADRCHAVPVPGPAASVVGFYSHPSSGDYRLLWLGVPWHNPQFRYSVLSLTTGTLRPLEPFLTTRGESRPVEFHRSLHWLGYFHDFFRMDSSIIAFDVEAEEFREIRHPEFRLSHDSCLMVMEGRLSLCEVSCGSKMSLWVLNDDVWTRRYNISIVPMLKTLGGDKSGWRIRSIAPLTGWGDREILMGVHRRGRRAFERSVGFVLYDLSVRRFRRVDVGRVDVPRELPGNLLFAHYKENIASPIKSFKQYSPDSKPD